MARIDPLPAMPSEDVQPDRSAHAGTAILQRRVGVVTLGDRPRTLPRWGALGLLVLLPVFLFFSFALHEQGWAYFGIFHLRPYFADTVAILAAGQAKHAGLGVYAPNPFDPYGRPHVYGPWWLITGQLGLKTADAVWLGPLFDLGFLVAAALVLARREFRETMLAAAFMISPPMLFGLERANNDLVVFVLLAAAAWLLGGGTRWRPAAGAGVLMFAAALKMYPVAAFPALARNAKSRSGRLILMMVALGSVVICWYEWANFRQALRLAPQPVSIFAFGLSTSVVIWDALIETRAWLVGGAVLALGLALVPLVQARRSLLGSVPSTGRTALFFVAAVLAWGACLCCASNYGYRLVLILAPIALWLSQWRDARLGRAARCQVAGWLLIFWLMLPKRWLGASAGHDSKVAMKLLSFVVGFEQVFVVMLTLALGIAVAGWLWRALGRSEA